jgi:hypothetical protein
VVTEEIKAGVDLDAGFDRFMPVSAAFWLEPTDPDRRRLYIASAQLDEAHKEMNDPHLLHLHVSLIRADNPLARSAEEVRRTYPAPRPIRLRNTSFGDLWAAEVYISPMPSQVGAP